MSLKIGHIIAPLTMYTKKEKRKKKNQIRWKD